jgi:muramoyltetrapeptide carboxypeptidase
VDVEKAWWWGPARPAEVGRELSDLFRDPDVRAIWGLAGGRFTLSYLDTLDYDAIAANPKPLIGMSDIGVLTLAIHSRTGLVTFHADPLLLVSEWHELSELDRARHADAYRRVLTSPEPAGPLPALMPWETWRPGRAEGRLLGGMLNRLIKVQASPLALAPDRFDGAILFFEDMNTPTINVWHDLQVLRQWGVFDRIAGLLVGPVETISIQPDADKTLREVVLDLVGERDIPVIGNVNLGHAGPNIPLPLGIRAPASTLTPADRAARGRRQLTEIMSLSQISGDVRGPNGEDRPVTHAAPGAGDGPILPSSSNLRGTRRPQQPGSSSPATGLVDDDAISQDSLAPGPAPPGLVSDDPIAWRRSSGPTPVRAWSPTSGESRAAAPHTGLRPRCRQAQAHRPVATRYESDGTPTLRVVRHRGVLIPSEAIGLRRSLRVRRDPLRPATARPPR